MTHTRRGILAAIVPASAMAQTPPAKGPNGGEMGVADGHPIELVLTPTEVTLHLSGEDGRPMSSARAAGRILVQQGGQTVTVALRPAAPNRLVGALPAPIGPGAKLVFQGEFGTDHRHRATARFVAR